MSTAEGASTFTFQIKYSVQGAKRHGGWEVSLHHLRTLLALQTAHSFFCPSILGAADQQNRVLKNYFVMYKLEADLCTRFRDQRFCEAIHHPMVRVKKNEDAYEDIYDGTVYPPDLQYGQLHALGSSDGIKVFKTTLEELWLVMLVILELPPEIRFVKHFMKKFSPSLIYSPILDTNKKTC